LWAKQFKFGHNITSRGTVSSDGLTDLSNLDNQCPSQAGEN